MGRSLKVYQDVSKLCQQGFLDKAIHVAEQMQHQGIPITREEAYLILQRCEKRKNLEIARRVLSLISHSGLDSISVLGDHLIRIFTCHGCLDEANNIFKKVTTPSVYTWAAVIMANAKLGDGKAALESYKRMQHSGLKGNEFIYIGVLKGCTIEKDLLQGRNIHNRILGDGYLSGIVGNAVVDMYAKCGSMDEAHEVFDMLPCRDVVAWNILISGYVQHGDHVHAVECLEKMQMQGIKPNVVSWSTIITGYAWNGKALLALDFFKRMQQEGIEPNEVTFISVLKACSSIGEIDQGRLIHKQIISCRFCLDVAVSNALIDMYAKCGSVEEASEVFIKIPHKDVVSWGSMIAGYAQHGKDRLAVQCFEAMQLEGIIPDEVSFFSILKACPIEKGRMIHVRMIKDGFFSDLVGTCLADMYAKRSSLEEAQRIFEKLSKGNAVVWNIIIAGYTNNMQGLLALKYLEKMQNEGVKPNLITFLSTLKACACTAAAEHGRMIHEMIIEENLQPDLIVASTLVDMYAKCGNLQEACKVFELASKHNVVLWGAMIAGYALRGEGIMALDCFERMQEEHLDPNSIILLSVLKACATTGAIEQGRLIHEKIICAGIQFDILIGSTLIDMYAKCARLEEARSLFERLPNRNVVSWNVLIAGHIQQGEGELALQLFENMQHEGTIIDGVVLLSGSKACAQIEAIEKGRYIHEMAIAYRLESDSVLITTLADMYVRCGSINEACNVLSALPDQDVASWAAMITGYAQHGETLLALHCFEMMQQEGIKPNLVALSGALKVSALLSALEQGRVVHEVVIENGLQSNIFVGSSLIDMYIKCGSLEEACKVFDKLRDQDTMSWGTMIAGYAHHGEIQQAIECVKKMEEHRLRPTSIVFNNILIACSRAGLVDEGQWYFKSMIKTYDVEPSISHFSCIVDLLSRGGLLIEAETLLLSNEADIVGWTSLFSASKLHGNVELGRRCFDEIVRLDSWCGAGYVLMSNMYADI